MPKPFTVFERRASTVLYRYLRGVERPGIWLIPANVCPIVPAIFFKAGKPFEFVDIAADTLCVDTVEILARIARDPSCYAGVLFVHTYGYNGNFESFFCQLKSHDNRLQIVDDRCLCRPKFDRAGSVAELELYSSGYSKFVDLDWGGWGHLRDGVGYVAEGLEFEPDAHDELVESFNATVKERRQFTFLTTCWLDARPPEVSFDQFRTSIESQLPIVAHHREQLNAIYSAYLASWALPAEFQDWRFTIRCANQMDLLARIFAAGHFASGHYASLVPMFGLGTSSNAAQLGLGVVNLFNDLRYTIARATELAESVSRYLRGA